MESTQVKYSMLRSDENVLMPQGSEHKRCIKVVGLFECSRALKGPSGAFGRRAMLQGLSEAI